MSAPEGPFPLERNGAAVDVQAHREVLLPDPPIGQLSRETIMSANEAGLQELANSRGLTLQDLTHENIGAHSVRSKRDFSKGTHYGWSREDKIRLALLYTEGYSAREIADEFDALRPENKVTVSEELVRVVAHDTLTESAFALAHENRLTRRWHALMRPENPRTEFELHQLEQKFSISRHRIFHNPTAIKAFRQRTKEGAKGSRMMLPDPEISVRLLYLKYCEGVQGKTLQMYAKNLTERDMKLYTFFGSILTEEGKRAFKMRRPREPWSTERYRYAASLLVMKNGIRVADIGAALNTTTTAVAAAMRAEGARLIKAREEYKDDSWFEAFVLEYAEPELYPAGTSPRVVVQALRADRMERGNARKPSRRKEAA